MQTAVEWHRSLVDDARMDLRERLKRSAWLYALLAPPLRACRRLARPGSFSIRYVATARRAQTVLLERAEREGWRILDLGAGERPISPRSVNLDFAPGPAVHLVADLSRLPLADGCADLLWMQGVIEHLERPEQVAAELGRILPPGGYLYADVVFLSRYHQAPEDYQRLTRPGLARLFEALEVVETGMLCGPASTLCDDARHMLALLTSFGSPGLFRWGYHYPWAYLTWPIKFLDVWLERHPMADRTAYAYFVIARKPG